jgi:hypothetical protein
MKLLTITMIGIAAILLVIVGCDREITGDVKLADNSSEGCFDCHSDTDLALTTARFQYDNSIHGAGENTNRNRLYNSRYASCEKCHTHQGFVAEVTGVPATGDEFSTITCFTCHAPHSSGDFTVRVTSPVALENGFIYDRGESNLCVSCHMSRRDVNVYVVDSVELSSHWGPHHSNQGDMLIAENSYEYSTYNYTESWHSTGVTEGCMSCHMSASMHETVGGHSWNMRNEDKGYENITGCNVTGCHDTDPITDLDRDAAADFDWDGTIEGTQTEIHGLLDSLIVLLELAGMADSTGHPISGRVISTADSAGALYNYLFVEEDRSVGVHNTDYAVGLLQSSINFLATGDPNGAPSGKIAMISSH